MTEFNESRVECLGQIEYSTTYISAFGNVFREQTPKNSKTNPAKNRNRAQRNVIQQGICKM